MFGTGRSVQDTAAGLAAPIHGGPAVDRSDIGVRDDLERDKGQHATDDNALDCIRDDVPPPQEYRPSATALLRATGLICIRHPKTFDDLSCDLGAPCRPSQQKDIQQAESEADM